MLKLINRKTLNVSAGFMAGMMVASGPAYANNFGSLGKQLTNSIADLPGLLSALSYMFGILLGVLGVMKIKDHVENPAQTHLKDGAVRLAAGGALLGLPLLFEAMQNTLSGGGGASAAATTKVSFNVN